MDRRRFLILGASAGAGLVGWRALVDDPARNGGSPSTTATNGDTTSSAPPPTSGPPPTAPASYGEIGPPDALGLQLPDQFTARVVAASGVVVEGTSYTWHPAPDGGACFPAPDGGWVYVSNSEAIFGGAGALRFDRGGSVVDAYSILSGTTANCAGGATPWGTWLSCEEHPNGQVWECDPLGRDEAVVRSAMGAFFHEAAACDPEGHVVYLTEDTRSGLLRRFRPTAWPDLATGVLEAAVVEGDNVTWVDAAVGGSAFNGGEGAWFADGRLWFTTKGDNRVWELDTRVTPNALRVVYDDSTSPRPVLTGVDNIVGSATGDLFVAEDGGSMELVRISPTGEVSVFLRLNGQPSSELAGPAFSPDGSRLYLSSQRGVHGSGITYEVRGPFTG